MPFESGTATDYSDLLDKLVTFATVTVPVAHRWVVMENAVDKVVLKGIGTGADAIYISIQKYADALGDAFGWYLNGYTGYVAGLNFVQQPGAMLADYPAMPLIDSTITYWLAVNNRRIVLVAKVAGTYQSCYLGYILPFATPNQYPYPLCIGGSCQGLVKPRYSGTANNNTVFCIPKATGSYPNDKSTLKVRLPSGEWATPTNRAGNTSLFSTMRGAGVYPLGEADAGGGQYSMAKLRPTSGGKYTLQPTYIQTAKASPDTVNRLGEFDGIKHLSGFGAAAEDTGTDEVAAVWLFVPNIFRLNPEDFYAMKLA